MVARVHHLDLAPSLNPDPMDLLHRLISGINFPTAVAAGLLVLAVIVVIRIGKVLIMAGVFGAVAGGASLGQGNPPGTAGVHAAIGFGVAAMTLFLIRFTRRLILWVVITSLGVGALLLYGFNG